MSQGILDSSPLPIPTALPPAAPGRPKGMKRSASTASLLTPPREGGNKRRKAAQASPTAVSTTDTDSDDAEPMFLVAKTARTSSRIAATSQGKLPLSPPKSKRRAAPAAATSMVNIPTTPPPRRSVRTARQRSPGPIRDSPENPFLVSDKNPVILHPRLSTPDREEKPTVAYVFRGVKAQFDNPLHNMPAKNREKARLPFDDPEFSPDPILAPRRLFADKSGLPVVQELDEDDDDDEPKLKPKRPKFDAEEAD